MKKRIIMLQSNALKGINKVTVFKKQKFYGINN